MCFEHEDDARRVMAVRGVEPGALGLGWGTGGYKRCGLGGRAEARKQAAGEIGIGDEGHDGGIRPRKDAWRRARA